MPLKNSQYDEIMREYERTRFIHQHEQQERVKKLYTLCPGLEKTIADIQSASAALTKAVICANTEEASLYRQQLNELREKKARLLASIGCSQKDLEVQYTCPDCKDTGYINGRKCRCFTRAGINLLFKNSRLTNIIRQENFSQFRLDYYSTAPNPRLKGESNRAHMASVLDYCRAYADSFTPDRGNILFSGNPGVGKTFLTNCIAERVLNKCYSVLSLSAIDMFEMLSKWSDSDSEEAVDSSYIMTCDLLIIDDLGTEVQSIAKTAQLFHCINTRILTNKATIISTNLSATDLRRIYSERVSSRIISNYNIFFIYGDDIRITKKFRSMS